MNSILHLKPTGQELLFANHIADMAAAAAHGVRFSQFLDARGCEIALCVAKQFDCEPQLFGGYPGAQRQMLCLHPSFISVWEQDFPLEAIGFRYKKEYTLSHRDVLGTILSLGVKRETVGDILIGEGQAAAFVSSSIALPILTDMEKIGGVGVAITPGLPQDFQSKQSKQAFSAVVSSLRLDGVVAALTGESREKAQKLVLGGLVRINGRTEQKSAATVCIQDELSIRGYGKFQITNQTDTKKGRIRISFFKFV